VPGRARLITLGVAVFFVGVVLFFPARVAYQWFMPAEIKVSGIDGTLWNGAAREANAGSVYLRELKWRIHPFELFTGRLGFAVETKLASGFLDGDFSFGITGTIAGRNVNAAMPLQALQAGLGIPGLQGGMSAQLSELEIEDGLPVVVNGVVNVSNLIVPLVQRDSLGGFKAEFLTQDASVVASVEDTDAVIDIAGSLQIFSDRRYQFLAQLSATENTPAPVRQQMQFLGSADERGQHEFRLEGTL
jgi:general secretion pathway protein N